MVLDAVIDAFVACIGWDPHMEADNKGLPPSLRAPQFECADPPLRSLHATFNREATAVAIFLAKASRDLMCLASGPRCPSL